MSQPAMTNTSHRQTGTTMVQRQPTQLRSRPVRYDDVVPEEIELGSPMRRSAPGGPYYEYEEGLGSFGRSYLSSSGGGCDDGCAPACELGCRTGGCPPELIGDCWLGGLGKLLRRAEYSGGVHGFKSVGFNTQQSTVPTNTHEDTSFGFNYGINVGVPLCRITCGLVSGQFGVRSVHSNFDGTPFSGDDRNQVFVTAGLYRRVDYGLQVGVVADYMSESWYTNVNLWQIRGDVSWVYPSGNAFGYRFTEGIQDDQTNGILNGVPFVGLVTDTIDSHRFYWRNAGPWGGFADLYSGFTDEKHVIFGVDADFPVSECLGLQAGFIYLLPRDSYQPGTPLNGLSEAWNISLGIVWRPQGRCWYRNYDQPILPVADNGSMLLRRQF